MSASRKLSFDIFTLGDSSFCFPLLLKLPLRSAIFYFQSFLNPFSIITQPAFLHSTHKKLNNFSAFQCFFYQCPFYTFFIAGGGGLSGILMPCISIQILLRCHFYHTPKTKKPGVTRLRFIFVKY
jgi:hypothetical protein